MVHEREGRKNRRELLDGKGQEQIQRGKGAQQIYEKGKRRKKHTTVRTTGRRKEGKRIGWKEEQNRQLEREDVREREKTFSRP